MTMRCIGILLLLSVSVPGCGDDDDNGEETGASTAAGRGGSTAAGTGGSTAAGRGGSTAAGTGGSTAAGTGGSPAAGSGAAGQGANERMVELVATEFQFTPDRIDAQPGETLIVTLRNEGEVAHRLEFELPDGDVELEEDVAPGDSAELTIQVPDETGDFVFYCPISGHRQLGMEGTLTVE